MKLAGDKSYVIRHFAGFLLFGSVATSLVFRNELFNIGIVLTSLALIRYSSSHSLKEIPSARLWLLSLIACSFIWSASIATTPDSELSDYEKPLKYLASALIVLQFLKLNVSSKYLFWGAVSCLVSVAVVVMDQRYYRLELDMNAGTAAYQLCIVLLIVASFLLFEKKVSVWEFVGGSLAIALGFWLILETQTRGALIVLLTYMIIVMVEKFREVSAKRRLAYSLFAGVIGCALLISVSTIGVVKKRVELAKSDFQRIEQGDLRGSIGVRVALLHVGLHAVKNPTVLGMGENSLENLKSYLAEMADGEKYKHVLRNLHFHNQYLDQFTKRGVLGFLAYIVFLFGPLLLASAEKRRALYAVVVPLGVGGLIETPFNNSNFITSYLLYTTYILVVLHNKKPELNSSQRPRDVV